MDVICEVALRCGIGVLACLAVVLVVVGIALLVERRSVGSFRNAVVLQRLFRRLLMTAALAAFVTGLAYGQLLHIPIRPLGPTGGVHLG